MWQPERSLVKLRGVEEIDVDNILSWVNDKSVVGNPPPSPAIPLTRADELAWVRRCAQATTIGSSHRWMHDDYLGEQILASRVARQRSSRTRASTGAAMIERSPPARRLPRARAAQGVADVFAPIAAHRAGSVSSMKACCATSTSTTVRGTTWCAWGCSVTAGGERFLTVRRVIPLVGLSLADARQRGIARESVPLPVGPGLGNPASCPVVRLAGREGVKHERPHRPEAAFDEVIEPDPRSAAPIACRRKYT